MALATALEEKKKVLEQVLSNLGSDDGPRTVEGLLQALSDRFHEDLIAHAILDLLRKGSIVRDDNGSLVLLQ